MDSVGLFVMSKVCNIDSEYVWFYHTLDISATADPSIKVRLDDLWSSFDLPHVIKKNSETTGFQMENMSVTFDDWTRTGV